MLSACRSTNIISCSLHVLLSDRSALRGASWARRHAIVRAFFRKIRSCRMRPLTSYRTRQRPNRRGFFSGVRLGVLADRASYDVRPEIADRYVLHSATCGVLRGRPLKETPDMLASSYFTNGAANKSSHHKCSEARWKRRFDCREDSATRMHDFRVLLTLAAVPYQQFQTFG